MCTVCGCASGEVRIDPDRVFADARFEPAPPAPRIARAGLVAPAHEAGRSDTHDHPPASAHRHAVAAPVADAGEDLHCLPAPRSGLSAAGIPESRLVRIEADLLAKNDAIARGNRAHFAGHRVLALNLVSSPGSGKTTLLVRTLEALRGRLPLAVIEGDQQTSNDAARIRATGVPAVQVNTGKGCHLDAVDLLPHLDFDVDALVANARRVRPGIAVIRVSARTGEGMEAWLKWIDAARTVQGLSP